MDLWPSKNKIKVIDKRQAIEFSNALDVYKKATGEVKRIGKGKYKIKYFLEEQLYKLFVVIKTRKRYCVNFFFNASITSTGEGSTLSRMAKK